MNFTQIKTCDCSHRNNKQNHLKYLVHPTDDKISNVMFRFWESVILSITENAKEKTTCTSPFDPRTVKLPSVL